MKKNIYTHTHMRARTNSLRRATARKRAQLTADLSGAVANKEIIWAE